MSAMELTAEQYHDDDTGSVPTLSASIARILCSKTPAHARAAHPRLNPNYERKSEEKFEIGTAIHSLLLNGVDLVHVVHENDWRKKDAQAARDEARSYGRIPLLAKQWHDVSLMLDAVRAQLAVLKVQPAPFANGQPEQTIVWDEDGVKCRARLDWITADGLHIFDLKTTSASAEPDAWRKTAYGMGADVQSAFYVRGAQAVYGTTFVNFTFVVAETYPPYAISLVNLSPAAIALANAKVDHALAVWKRCLETDSWPGYPAKVASVDPPAWEEARWLDRTALLDEVAA